MSVLKALGGAGVSCTHPKADPNRNPYRSQSLNPSPETSNFPLIFQNERPLLRHYGRILTLGTGSFGQLNKREISWSIKCQSVADKICAYGGVAVAHLGQAVARA